MEIKEAVALIKQEFNMRVVDRNVREAIDTWWLQNWRGLCQLTSRLRQMASKVV